MRPRLETHSDSPSIVCAFTSLRSRAIVGRPPGGFFANHTDRFYHSSISRVCEGGYYSFVHIGLTLGQVLDNSTRLTGRWGCACVPVPICLRWASVYVPRVCLGLPDRGPYVRYLARRTPE
jgi:hypothetical protein